MFRTAIAIGGGSYHRIAHAPLCHRPALRRELAHHSSSQHEVKKDCPGGPAEHPGVLPAWLTSDLPRVVKTREDLLFGSEDALEHLGPEPGPDGQLGTADDVHQNANQTTSFVDQNQTYSSHPSHQVFLRAYELNAAGAPVATGKLIVGRDLGADGHFGTADDVVKGGMATWAVVKAQARDLLGINLTDADLFDVPLIATDAYGNFLKGPNGRVQVVMKGADGIAGTADDVLVEGKKIVAVGRHIDAGGAAVIDARGRIVMPGFIDTHHHLFETALRSWLADGLLINDGSNTPSGNQPDFENILLRFAPVYRPQDVYINELFVSLVQLDTGVTTVMDV